ncbi:MAG: ATPase [Chloroflexi bacterium]|nr:ATPase [Chloroflexota bacterium]
MKRYFLGVDIGGTKTHALLADEQGNVVGFGRAGPGNHEVVGYDGLASALCEAAGQALSEAGATRERVAGAGFGVAGYDWPSELPPTMEAIGALKLSCPVKVVNDAVIGLVAGAEAGWGVALVAGTSNNCWGMDESGRLGRVTGGGSRFGEYGGAIELVNQAIIAIAKAWSRRGPETALTAAFAEHFGVENASQLLERIQLGRYHPGPSLAPLVFRIADEGDRVARDLIRWSGEELADLALGVIRQLDLAQRAFDIVLVGSMFNGGSHLMKPLQARILAEAPAARFVRLTAPPALGAVLLGMQAAGLNGRARRQRLFNAWLAETGDKEYVARNK